jgi:glycine dehydrogenase subunit 1
MKEQNIAYPYIPNSDPKIKKSMLKEIGVRDAMDLYKDIPEKLKLNRELKLPEPILDEHSLRTHVDKLIGRNSNCQEYLNFLGSGCAQHYVPAVCDEINNRGEFLSAYVSDVYADHGKFQSIFEYCSLMGELLDMDVLSIPLYDGGQAAASSIRMASRINGKHEVLIPKTMNIENKLVVKNYCKPELIIKEINYDRKTGLLDLKDLKKNVSNKTSSIFIENPNYLGMIENQVDEISQIASNNNIELIVYTDPISLGILKPPREYGATITCGDIQPLGMHMNGGGGQAGFIATKDDMKYIKEFKDLMYGITETVEKGEYGFANVLFDRTLYGSREKGVEYSGTGNAIWGITAAVYLSLLGKKGIKEVGQLIRQMAIYTAKQISEIDNVELVFESPLFKEFVINFDKTKKSVSQITNKLLDHKIFMGKDLSQEFPELGQSALFCVTECKTKSEIDYLKNALLKVI